MDKFKIPVTFEELHRAFITCRHNVLREWEQLYRPVGQAHRSFNVLITSVSKYGLKIVPSRQIGSGSLVFTVEEVLDFHQDGTVVVRYDTGTPTNHRATSAILGAGVGTKSSNVFNRHRLYTPEGTRVAINNLVGSKTYIVINDRVYGINNLLIRDNKVVRSTPIEIRVKLPAKYKKQAVHHLTQFYTAQAAAMRLKGGYPTIKMYVAARRLLLDEICSVLASYMWPVPEFGRKQIKEKTRSMLFDNTKVFTDVLPNLLYNYAEVDYLVADPIK